MLASTAACVPEADILCHGVNGQIRIGLSIALNPEGAACCDAVQADDQ
jgi:hypothetical protein